MMSRDFCKDIGTLFNTVVPSVKEFDEIIRKGKILSFDEMNAIRPDVGKYIQKLKERLEDNDYCKSIEFYEVGTERIVLKGIDNRKCRRSLYALVDGNSIYCPSGNVIGDGPVNEFMNNTDGFIPNSYYHTENVVYKIDLLGRVCETFEYHVTERKTNRNEGYGDISKIAKAMGGKDGDISGHIVAHAIDGPSEAINIVPMNNTFNNSDKWKKMENRLKEAYQNHINSWVHKVLKYDADNTQRPCRIDVEMRIEDYCSFDLP